MSNKTKKNFFFLLAILLPPALFWVGGMNFHRSPEMAMSLGMGLILGFFVWLNWD